MTDETREKLRGYIQRARKVAQQWRGENGDADEICVLMDESAALLEAEEESGASNMQRLRDLVATLADGSTSPPRAEAYETVVDIIESRFLAPQPEPEEGEPPRVADFPDGIGPEIGAIRAKIRSNEEHILEDRERIKALEKQTIRNATVIMGLLELHDARTPEPDSAYTSLRCHRCGELRTEMQPCLCEPDSESEGCAEVLEKIRQVWTTWSRYDAMPDEAMTRIGYILESLPERDEGGEDEVVETECYSCGAILARLRSRPPEKLPEEVADALRAVRATIREVRTWQSHESRRNASDLFREIERLLDKYESLRTKEDSDDV